MSVAVLIISSIALNRIEDNFPPVPSEENEIIKKNLNVDYNQMIIIFTTGSEIAIALAAFIILYEIMVIIIRFVNVNLINKKIKVFLSLVSADKLGIDSAAQSAEVLFRF